MDDMALEIERTLDRLKEALRPLQIPGGPEAGGETVRLMLSSSELRFRKRSLFTAEINLLKSAIDKVKKLEDAIFKLSVETKESIEQHSEIIKWRDPDDPDVDQVTIRRGHESLDSAIAVLGEELEAERKRCIAEKKRIWIKTKGNDSDVLARIIARKVANIFIYLNRGKLPRYSKDHDDFPNNPYVRAVGEVFTILGIRTGFRGPCADVVAELEAERGCGRNAPKID